MLLLGVLDLPHFGTSFHPYRDAAVPAAVSHATSNVISSVNFDLRGLDTLGEETILLTSVLGVAALLRPAEDEDERKPGRGGRLLDMTRLFGYVFMPVTLAIGFITVAHGALTPGGGFQGGVVLGTGIHLLYVAGSYHAIEKVRPVEALEYGESLGAGEILLTSMDADGVQGGFDCPLTQAVAFATNVPIIASGGAGKPEDFIQVLTDGKADAALGASVFHYGRYTVSDLKRALAAAQVPVRPVV